MKTIATPQPAAVSRWPVTMSAFAKPYSFDLLMALLLLVPAVEWLRRPERIGWLALLALGTRQEAGFDFPLAPSSAGHRLPTAPQ
jgi:hypothetical protein